MPFALYLANISGWHAPFLFLGMLALLVTLVIIFAIPSLTTHMNHGARIKPLKQLHNILQNKNQLRALLFIFLLVCGQFTVIPFISPSLVINAGMTEAQLPLIYLIGGIASIIASPYAGRMSDIHGKRKVFTIGVLASTLPIFVITHFAPTPLYYILPMMAFFFVCMSSRMVPAMAMLSATVHSQKRGSFMSITSATQQLSASFASYISGIIVVRDASGYLLNYDIVGFIAIFSSLLALVLAYKIQPAEGKF